MFKFLNMLNYNDDKTNDDLKTNFVSLKDAFDKNDIGRVDHFLQQYKFNTNLFIDSALEDGNDKMTKLLVCKYNAAPSLYAKQMAHINGHHKLVFWMDAFTKTRNDTGINIVHKHVKNGWNECIPEEYRF